MRGWMLLMACTLTAWRVFGATVGGSVGPEGVEVQNDLPREMHLRNRGGSDGAGLCVFASIQHSALWQDVPQLQRLFEWMQKRPGGGWPEKVDRMIAELCKQDGTPPPEYLQIQGRDLDALKLACRTGRIPAVTYNFSPSGRYGGARIAHMVTLLHADDRVFAILDNNFPGTIEWMSPTEFARAYMGRSQGWAVILLAEGPPPVPAN